MWLRRYYILWTIFWLGCLVYLFVNDINFSGDKLFVKDFQRNQFTLSYLFPLGRTELSADGQRLVAEPIYFTVYAPREYSLARLTLQTTVPVGSQTNWQIGYQTAPGFNYELLPQMLVKGHNELAVNLSLAYRENNKYRFILVHNLTATFNPLTINGLAVELKRPKGFLLRDYLEDWFSGFNFIL